MGTTTVVDRLLCSSPGFRRDRLRIVHTAALLLAACVAPAEVGPPSDDGWTSQTFAWPPSFAPELPPGEESVLFAPGFQDPQSEEYWSYAFAVWIDGPIPDAGGLADLLDAYYDGLVSMTARAEGKDAPGDPAQVEVRRVSADRFEGVVHLIDASGTSEPADLRLLIACGVAERAVMRIRVSPQPSGHAIWRALEAAVMRIQEP